MDAKFDPYEGFDPTSMTGGGCSCEGGVYWDMVTQTWKQGKTATAPQTGDCSQVEAQLKQAQADKAKADEKAAKAEEAKATAEEKATEAAKALEAAKEAEEKATADKEAAEQAKAEVEQAKEAAEAEAESARLLVANANAAKDQAERDKEAAQESEAAAIAKAENAKAEAAKAKEDLNEALAELVTKQNEITAKDAEIAELKRKLEECQQDKCPEVDVVSLGDETVFSGNSCDKVEGLGGEGNFIGIPNENFDHL